MAVDDAALDGEFSALRVPSVLSDMSADADGVDCALREEAVDAVTETDGEPFAVVDTVEVAAPLIVTSGLTETVNDDDVDGLVLMVCCPDRDPTEDADAEVDTDNDF